MGAREGLAAASKCCMRTSDGKVCGRDVYDNEGRCICHSRDACKAPQAFNAAIEEVFASQRFDFCGFVFPEDADFMGREFTSDTSFAGAIFQGAAVFYRAQFQGEADFGNARFRGTANFYNAQFQGEANFRLATFEGEAQFRDATFQSIARFVSATFEGRAHFGATFEGEADFRGAAFKEPADFSLVTFQGKVNFWEAKFECKAEFLGAKFQREAFFYTAMFRGTSDFAAATFCDTTNFGRATFAGAAMFGPTTSGPEAEVRPAAFKRALDFGFATFDGTALFVGFGGDWLFACESDTDFRHVTFRQPQQVRFEHVCLRRARFLGTDLRRVDFTDVDWASRPFWGPMWQRIVARHGRPSRAIHWTCRKWPLWAKPRGRFAVWDELAPETSEYVLIGKLYRELKYNLEEQRDPITAGDFHFGEMHVRRLSRPLRNRFWRFWKRNWSFLALYRWISGYGEDYVLALLWIAVVVVLFAFVFAFAPSFALEPSKPGFVHQFARGLLHSVMCLLLRSSRPFHPMHLAGQWLSVIEGIIGAPLIAMFVLALNRRFKR